MPLTPSEERVLELLRALQPYERIEIALNPDNRREIVVQVKSTLREVFPRRVVE